MLNRVMFGVMLALCAVLAPQVVSAQTAGTITFNSTSNTGVGSVTTTLTWSTTPVAASCVATGDPAWAGAKAASGTQTLTGITKSATLNLQCSWGKADLTVRWEAPTKNTDGTSLTDLAGFKVYWTGTGGSFSSYLPGASLTSALITPTTAGTYSFSVTAANANGIESDKSNSVSGTNTAATATKAIGIVVNAQPNAPTGVTAQ